MMQLAAFLVIALGLAHSVLGERYILERLFRREDLPKIFGSSQFTAQTLRFAWHITTVAWVGLAALLVQIGQGQLTSSSAAQIIGFTSIASGLLPLVITRGKHCHGWYCLQLAASRFSGAPPNNSFKPNLLRSSKSVAEKACHAFASTTQVGLIQALGPMDPIAAFAIPIAVALVVGLLLRSAASDATTIGGRTTITYGWGFKAFAIFAGVIPLALLAGMFFVPPQERVWLLLMALMFGFPALYLLLEGFFVRIVYSDQGLEAFSPWRKNRFVSWDDIARVSYSPGAKWHRIEVNGQGFIRLHDMKSGVPTLLQELRRRDVSGA